MAVAQEYIDTVKIVCDQCETEITDSESHQMMWGTHICNECYGCSFTSLSDIQHGHEPEKNVTSYRTEVTEHGMELVEENHVELSEEFEYASEEVRKKAEKVPMTDLREVLAPEMQYEHLQ